jgi:hypothetical protein
VLVAKKQDSLPQYSQKESTNANDKWTGMVTLLFHNCVQVILIISLCQSSVFMIITTKRQKQLKPNIVSSRVCLPPVKNTDNKKTHEDTTKHPKFPWLAKERELHLEVCLQPAAAPPMKVVL